MERQADSVPRSQRTGGPDDALHRQPLLKIEDLTIGIDRIPSWRIVDGLNLEINAGEVVALVGESGSGKSLTALSLMRLLPPGISAMGGRILFEGTDVLAMSQAELTHLRGGRISMIFQQPQMMLDPTSRVGTQVAESLRLHKRPARSAVRDIVVRLLSDVGIPDPALRAQCFAHELSGGMAQRVMMAAAMSGGSSLLIADEPTTALDVTIQVQILKLLDDQRRRLNLAILLITHDLSIVSVLADRVAVMYAGRIVEEGPTRTILRSPRHPYTKALVQCSLLKTGADGTLISIPGSTSKVQEIQQGCRFQPRCPTAAASGLSERCSDREPELDAYDAHSKCRCWAMAAVPHPAVVDQAARP